MYPAGSRDPAGYFHELGRKMIYRVVHNKDNPYFQLNRYSVNDDRLSFKAVGILAYLLSKPDNWKIQEDDLVKRHTDGATSVHTGLKELKDLGYIVSRPVRDENSGKITGWESHIFEQPQTVESPENVGENHLVGKPPSGNTVFWETGAIVSNEDLITNRGKETIRRRSPQVCVPPSDGFILTKEDEPKKPSYSMLTAQRLYDALVKKRKISAPPNLNLWAKEIRQFLIDAEYTREDVDPVLDWWIEHSEEDYVPTVLAAKSFINKFDMIVSRMRQSNGSVRNSNGSTPIQMANEASGRLTLENRMKRKEDGKGR